MNVGWNYTLGPRQRGVIVSRCSIRSTFASDLAIGGVQSFETTHCFVILSHKPSESFMCYQTVIVICKARWVYIPNFSP